MNEDKLTGVEKSIHAAVETFQKNLCREMAKRLDEGRLILDMETEVSFTTADVDEFIEEQIGYPITMVSNGPGREDIIYRNK